MIGDAHLASDHDIVLHYGAAGESSLGSDDDILADLHIVSHMN